MIINVGQLAIFFLILARIAGIFIQAPILNSRSIPFLIKSAMVTWITIVLWFTTPIAATLPNSLFQFALTLASEVAIGFTIGFICNIIFTAIQAGGSIIDLQMGLSVATALDPTFGATISIVGRLCFYTGIFVFVVANGHHLIFSALHQSFTVLPAGTMANFGSPELAQIMIALGSTLWLTAIKLAAPVVLLIFLSDFTFGIVSRVAPQVNVFMLGFQVKPLLGAFGIMMSLPFMIKHMNRLIEYMAEQLILFAQAVK